MMQHVRATVVIGINYTECSARIPAEESQRTIRALRYAEAEAAAMVAMLRAPPKQKTVTRLPWRWAVLLLCLRADGWQTIVAGDALGRVHFLLLERGTD